MNEYMKLYTKLIHTVKLSRYIQAGETLGKCSINEYFDINLVKMHLKCINIRY